MKDYIVGADVSTLYELNNLGAKFYDFDGQETQLLPFLKACGVSSVRLRLWLDPQENGVSYGAGGCNLQAVMSMARAVKNAQMSFMLDLHYSDFWTDPAKQTKPKAWKDAHGKELVNLAEEYTQYVIKKFVNENLEPDFVQVGNEITNGMLWPDGQLFYDPVAKQKTNFEGLIAILKPCIAAVRRVCSARVILHLENSGSRETWQEWCESVLGAGVDCDILGASYYPYWHGTMEKALDNIAETAKKYGKTAMIVETSYAFTRELYSKEYFYEERAKLVVGNDFTSELEYPTTERGQAEFMRDLLNKSAARGIKAAYYWEPAWLPIKGTTWASELAVKYIHEEEKPLGNEWANQALFDYDGKPLEALKEISRFADKK